MLRHCKDVLLLAVTLLATGVMAGLATVMVAAVVPEIAERQLAISYCVAMLLAGCAAGYSLMWHLKWRWRFRIFALGLPALAVLGVIVDAVLIQSSMTLVDRLILAPQLRPGPLVVAAGALIGAAIARRRTATGHAGET